MIAKLRASLAHVLLSRSLSARAMQSSAWVVVGFAGQRGLQFISNLILTRLLFPEAFGVMALASVFFVGLGMFSDIGLKPAIIRDNRSRDPSFLNTAWTIQVVRGFGLFGAGCLLGYPVSVLYGEPVLFPILMIVSSTAAISGFQTIGLATSERDLKFFKPTAVALLGQAVSIVALVFLAWYWRSVWALAVGNVIGSVATVLIGHWLLRSHRHRFSYDKRFAQSIVHFGRWIVLSTMVTFLGGEGLRAIQGKLLTLSEFGVLTIAYTIAVIATELPARLSNTIGLPALAEARQAGQDRVAHVLWQMRKRLILIAVPMAIVVAMISTPFIEIFYDQRYHQAGDFIKLLILANIISIVSSGYYAAILALLSSRILFLINFFTAFLRIIGVITGFYLLGTTGMILGLGVANMIALMACWTMSSLRGLTTIFYDALSVAVTVLAISIFNYM